MAARTGTTAQLRVTVQAVLQVLARGVERPGPFKQEIHSKSSVQPNLSEIRSFARGSGIQRFGRALKNHCLHGTILQAGVQQGSAAVEWEAPIK